MKPRVPIKAVVGLLATMLVGRAFACDVILVKGKATADGSVILVGLYEWGPTPHQPYPIMHVDRQTHKPGEMVELSFREIPQVPQTWAYNYVHCRFRPEDKNVPSVAHAINEWGVAIVSASIYHGKVKGSEPDGVDFFDVNRLVAERAKTAEQGADLIGKLIEKYGYPSHAKDKDQGQVWVVADPKDAWVVECAGGHHWVARRIQEDFYIASNAPTITNKFDRGSDVIQYALDQKWIEKREDFDWRRDFGEGRYHWKERLEAIHGYLTSPQRYGRITPQTIKDMLRSKGVGNVRSIPSSQATTIAHLRGNAPAPLRAKAWIATRSPWGNNLFLPLYSFQSVDLPKQLAAPDCVYWAAKRKNLTRDDCMTFETWADAQATELEGLVKSDLSKDSTEDARRRILDFHQQLVERAVKVYTPQKSNDKKKRDSSRNQVARAQSTQKQPTQKKPAQEQPTREDKIVKAIEALGGRVVRAKTLPGRPVHGVDLSGTKVTDAGMKDVKELNGLRILSLKGTRITDAGMKELKELNSLRVLSLEGTLVGDAGLKYLKELKKLALVSLAGTRITDAGLKDLKGIRAVILDLGDNARITDVGMKDLKELGLQKLYLIGNNNITDAGLKKLKGLKGLRGLWLSSPRITDAGLKELRKALPKTHIEWKPREEKGKEKRSGEKRPGGAG